MRRARKLHLRETRAPDLSKTFRWYYPTYLSAGQFTRKAGNGETNDQPREEGEKEKDDDDNDNDNDNQP